MSRFFFFFFNDTATTEIYTLSLHDALPIFAFSLEVSPKNSRARALYESLGYEERHFRIDRKSTRLNSSHVSISYAVFCLKKKNKALCAARASSGYRVSGSQE